MPAGAPCNAIDRNGPFVLNGDMYLDRATALQLIAFSASLAAIFGFILISLSFISAQCMNGTPFLPAIFPCFGPP